MADSQPAVVITVGRALLANTIDSVEIGSTYASVVNELFVGTTRRLIHTSLSISIPLCAWLAGACLQPHIVDHVGRAYTALLSYFVVAFSAYTPILSVLFIDTALRQLLALLRIIVVLSTRRAHRALAVDNHVTIFTIAPPIIRIVLCIVTASGLAT